MYFIMELRRTAIGRCRWVCLDSGDWRVW